MSGSIKELKIDSDDVIRFLLTEAHIGSMNANSNVKKYIWGRRNDGVQLINLKYTWEKLLLAARAIAAIENPADICVVTSREHVKRAVLKFGKHLGDTTKQGYTTPSAITERFPPGCFTNRNHQEFKEPRLLIVSDPVADHQAVKEASYCNLPVISFVDSESPLKFIDVAIPCNNKGRDSIAFMYWLLAREVLFLKGKIPRDQRLTFKTFINGKEEAVMPDLYIYLSADEQKKKELEKLQRAELEQKQQGMEDESMQIEKKIEDVSNVPLKPLPKPDKIVNWAAEVEWEPPVNTTQLQEQPNAESSGANWGGGNVEENW